MEALHGTTKCMEVYISVLIGPASCSDMCMSAYIRRPLLVRGHQAAKRFIIVSLLLSLYCFKFSSFPCILHSLLVSSFLSKFYSCKVSLFLCCYRAHRVTFPPSLDSVPSAWALPGYPWKIIDLQTCSPDIEKSEKVRPRYPESYQKDIRKSIGSNPVY